MYTMPAARLSNAHEHHPLNPQHHHDKHLDFQLMKELPDSHAWVDGLNPQEAPAAGRLPATEEPVPVVDLMNDPNAEQLIGHASKTWGVFQVVNHGVPNSVIDDMESVGKKLFSLPLSQKLKAARGTDGAAGYGPARISSFFPKLMWSEGFTIFGPPQEHFVRLWPHDYRKFCDAVEEYENEMKKLAGKLMRLALGHIGLTMADVTCAGPERHFEGKCAAIQLNSYPICPDPNRAMGLAAHTDSTLLTILHQDGTNGLQVFREGVGWVEVPPIPGGLVINIGDLMHILSNGTYANVLHRAVVNQTRQRLSIAYLLGSPAGALISPSSRLVDADHPPLYRSVTWVEYLKIRSEHFDNALPLLRSHLPLNNGFNGDVNDHNKVEVDSTCWLH